MAQAARIAWKNLHIEGRSREVVYTMGFMAALVVLVFSFAFISGQETTVGPDAVAGILWVAVLFSGTVALSRTFDRERESEAIRSLLLSPVPRSAIYAGKLAATAAIMFFVELLLDAFARGSLFRRHWAARALAGPAAAAGNHWFLFSGCDLLCRASARPQSRRAAGCAAFPHRDSGAARGQPRDRIFA